MDNETGKEGLKGTAGSHSAKCPAHTRHLPAMRLGLPGLRASYLRPEVPTRSKHLGVLLEATALSTEPWSWNAPAPPPLQLLVPGSVSPCPGCPGRRSCQPASLRLVCVPLLAGGPLKSRDCGLSPTPLWSGVQCLAQSRHRERVLKEYFYI